MSSPDVDLEHQDMSKDNVNKESTEEADSTVMVPAVGAFVSGVMVLVCLVTNREMAKSHPYYDYGIAVAVVGMFLSLVLTAVDYIKKNTTIFAVLLFSWSFIGASILTFEGPFLMGMVVFSLMALGVTKDKAIEATEGIASMLGLFVSSILLLTALVTEDNFNRDNEVFGHMVFGHMVFGTVVSAITLPIAGFFIHHHKKTGMLHSAQFMVMVPLCTAWLVAPNLLTFVGPFLTTGNGYFATWAGAITSVYATMAALSS